MRQYQADPAPIDLEFKKENRKVANWLLFYEERKAEYERLREAIIESSPCLTDAVPGGKNAVSDPTARKAVELARLQETEKWLQLVEEVENRLPLKMKVFLRLRREYRYRTGRNGWIAPVQWRYAQELAKILGKNPEDTWIESRTTFYYWWERIVEYAARLAAKKGLL
ncbi:hypothetical protein ciss_07250 [Carboxydothermus islandicus]|uniref:Uncharacterized protein n=1 Tax=Carboxydothermus islandicus TaxID=661089 RepID=A0A1L8D0V4_9THEO|nr:hypothetical protein [Carboxydothermus islandicus]GAV24792.1 hypothetical protein ciss_07250 [Carboxydothermus islandicus]